MTKCNKVIWGETSLCKWHTYFWMTPYLIWYFLAIIFYIERKWLLMRNLATILSLKSKLCGKFQRLQMEVSKCWKVVEFQKNSIKMKNSETLYEAQRASRFKETIQPPPKPFPSDKALLSLWNKNFLTEIYRNTQAFAFIVLQECVSWTSRNGAVQMFFWH